MRRPGRWGVAVALVLLALGTADGCRGRRARRARQRAAHASPTPLPALAWTTGDTALDNLARRIRVVLTSNRQGFAGATGRVEGFGAGGTYPQVWLRDSATILPVARYYYPRAVLLSWLEEHLAHQQESGALYDWIAPGEPEDFPYAPRAQVVYRAADGTVLSADTNTTEADQESSAVLAAAQIEAVLQDPAWLQHPVAGRALLDRLDDALRHVGSARRDARTGLITNALTADWGDVSPTYPDQRAIYLDERTPLVAGLYTNSLYVGAAAALASLHEAAGDALGANEWKVEAARARVVAATKLWRPDSGLFAVHAEIDPRGLVHDDRDTFALGGHAVAALFGLLGPDRLAHVLDVAEARHRDAGIPTLAATLLPPYPAGFFSNPALSEPGTYQNGGQWDWFSGRFVLALFRDGEAEAARRHLVEIAHRVETAGGLFEWYTTAGEGRGSPQYAGSAAALGQAVVEGLFGVELDARGLAIHVRLGESGGSIEALETETGRYVQYSLRRTANGALQLRWRTKPAPRTLEVLLPPGRAVAFAVSDGHAAALASRRVGVDRYAVLAGAGETGTLDITLRPASADTDP